MQSQLNKDNEILQGTNLKTLDQHFGSLNSKFEHLSGPTICKAFAIATKVNYFADETPPNLDTFTNKTKLMLLSNQP